MKDKPDYSTWIRKKKIYAIGAITFLFIGLAFCSFFNLLFLLSIIPSLFFLYITFIVTMNYYQFSTKGGDYQNKIHELLIKRAIGTNIILDIGCGNGNLAIKIAKQYPNCNVIGLDYWGKEWEYSVSICENNARIENVSNINFVQGSASKLLFENASIDCIVSCLTFHEVQDIKEKEDCLKEAIRVLKLDGRFVFLDLFDSAKYYPIHAKYKEVITNYGGRIDEDKAVNEILKLPFPLNYKRSLKYARIISGIKKSDFA
jgi:ubiquinone/menaquinone biosynthesis C-methylase UbiE